MKILNLYACLGGNRYLWGDEHEITAVELDPEGPMAQKIKIVKQKIREAQQSLAQDHSLPPHVLDELRQEFQSVMP